MVTAKTRKKQRFEKNKNYNLYTWLRVLMMAGFLLFVAAGIMWIFLITLNTTNYYGYILYVYPAFFVLALASLVAFFVYSSKTSGFVTRKCDIMCYTRINGRFYGKIQGFSATKKRKVTIFIDFHTGVFDHVLAMPKLIPLPLLHIMPEFLMYYAYASLFKNSREGIDVANNFIADNKYFHRDHKRANVVYATSFGVVRYTAKMMDGKYTEALDCLRFLKITSKKYRYFDALVRFCKGRAEHEMALAAKEEGDAQKAFNFAKAALGKYAYVGRNAGNLYLAKQAEFYRVQLHEAINQKSS